MCVEGSVMWGFVWHGWWIIHHVIRTSQQLWMSLFSGLMVSLSTVTWERSVVCFVQNLELLCAVLPKCVCRGYLGRQLQSAQIIYAHWPLSSYCRNTSQGFWRKNSKDFVVCENICLWPVWPLDTEVTNGFRDICCYLWRAVVIWKCSQTIQVVSLG